MMNTYRDVACQVLDDIDQVAADVDIPVEKVFQMKRAFWKQEAAREQELMTTRAEISAERAAAAEALPSVLAPFKANGTWPRPRDIMSKLGLPPTKSHLGWVSYQLRQLSYQPAQPSAHPAE